MANRIDALLLTNIRQYCDIQAKALPNGLYLGRPIDRTTNRVFSSKEEAVTDWIQYVKETTKTQCAFCREPAIGEIVINEHTFPICQRCATKRMVDELEELDKALNKCDNNLNLLKAMMERKKCEAKEEIDWLFRQGCIISILILVALLYLVWGLF